MIQPMANFKVLKSPNARYDTFDSAVDDGLADWGAAMDSLNDAIVKNSTDALGGALVGIYEAEAHFESADKVYPGLDPVCLR